MNSLALADCEFVVVDVETTGFDAAGRDRVVEIGMVQLGRDYQVTAEYGSLVNPQRDPGATHIHGITGADVRDAPLFADVADDIVAWLGGRVFVAHNAPFDLRFINAEFGRLGLELPAVAAVDTLRLTNLKLERACRLYGVQHESAHSALGDARATATLLQRVIEQRFSAARSLDDIGCRTNPLPASAWSSLTSAPGEHRRPPLPRRDP